MYRKKASKKPSYSEGFRKQVVEHFKVFIECGIAPRKAAVLEFLQNAQGSSSDGDISWGRVKDLVWNEIKKKKKDEDVGKEFREEVKKHFEEEINNGKVPKQQKCQAFLDGSNTAMKILPWQSVKIIVLNEIKGKNKN